MLRSASLAGLGANFAFLYYAGAEAGDGALVAVALGLLVTLTVATFFVY